MKNLYLILTVLLITIGCKKDENSIFIPKNYLQKFQTEKKQILDLDTISFKEIIGKNGTKFYYNREDFNISKGDEITLELIELYDFKEILYRNINTVTTKNELLETNGVLYISFKSKGKEIKLKENKKLLIYPPKGKLNNNDIFITKNDSINNIKWDITDQNYIKIVENRGGGVSVETIIHKDSLPTYENRKKEIAKLVSESDKIKEFFIVTNDDFGWINIDRIVNVDFKMNFNLINKENQFSGFNIYYSYKNLKSFISDARLKDDLNFDSIPISGKTWMTIIGEKNNILFYDKIELKKELNNSEIILKMKKTDEKELQKLLIN